MASRYASMASSTYPASLSAFPRFEHASASGLRRIASRYAAIELVRSPSRFSVAARSFHALSESGRSRIACEKQRFAASWSPARRSSAPRLQWASARPGLSWSAERYHAIAMAEW